MLAYLACSRGSEMASASSRRAELSAKQTEISPVISVECSDTGSRNLLKPDAMSWAVSADATRAMALM